MLINNITESIKKMKKLDMVENAALNAEKKAKNDSEYKGIVEEYYCSLKKIQLAAAELDYSISIETLQNMEDVLESLNNAESSGEIEYESLSTARQFFKKLTSNLNKDWNDYYQKKTSSSLSKLNTLGHLTSTAEEIASLRTKIKNGNDWTGLSLFEDDNNSRLDQYISAISEIDELEEALNLSEEIKEFIVKVTSGKARVDDINSDIMDWIKQENLEKKFVISFDN